jgi:GT2 family glycosyltransferase
VKTDLTVIVPSYNTRNLLRKCLQTIPIGAPELVTTVLVVDNASQDGSLEMIGLEFPKVIMVPNQANLGFARAVNIGFRESNDDLVLVANSDLEFPNGSIAKLVSFLQNHPSVGIVGPQLIYMDGRWQRSSGSPYTLSNLWKEALLISELGRRLEGWCFARGYCSQKPREVGHIDGACMLVRTWIFAFALGGWAGKSC